MIELRFYSGKAYSAHKVWDDGACCLSLGSDDDDKKIAIVELKRFGICLVGDEELYSKTKDQPNLIRQDTHIVSIALKFIFSRLTPEKFCELMEQLARDRYVAGHTDGKNEIRQGLRDLLEI